MTEVRIQKIPYYTKNPCQTLKLVVELYLLDEVVFLSLVEVVWINESIVYVLSKF